MMNYKARWFLFFWIYEAKDSSYKNDLPELETNHDDEASAKWEVIRVLRHLKDRDDPRNWVATWCVDPFDGVNFGIANVTRSVRLQAMIWDDDSDIYG